MKDTLIKIFTTLLVMVGLFVAGYTTRTFNLNKQTASTDSVFNQIDTVLNARILYKDSIVKVKKTIVDNYHVSNGIHIDSFKSYNDLYRQRLIDSILEVDSIPKKYSISDSQAVRVINLVDSNSLLKGLLKAETDDLQNCDNTISKIDTLVDTLKIANKDDIEKAKVSGYKVGAYSTAGLFLLLITGFFIIN